jgi:hypothetical protein
MRIPERGDIYQHFRGDFYKVVDVIRCYPGTLREGETFEHLASGKSHPVRVTAESDVRPGDMLIFYQGSNGVIHARSRQNFQQVLGDGREGTHYYRFSFISAAAS